MWNFHSAKLLQLNWSLLYVYSKRNFVEKEKHMKTTEMPEHNVACENKMTIFRHVMDFDFQFWSNFKHRFIMLYFIFSTFIDSDSQRSFRLTIILNRILKYWTELTKSVIKVRSELKIWISNTPVYGTFSLTDRSNYLHSLSFRSKLTNLLRLRPMWKFRTLKKAS